MLKPKPYQDHYLPCIRCSRPTIYIVHPFCSGGHVIPVCEDYPTGCAIPLRKTIKD